MIFARSVLACLLLTILASEVVAQCVPEDSALGTCLEGAGFTDAEETACEECIGTVVRSTLSTPCDSLPGSACTDLAACPCPESCGTELYDYFTCENNADRLDNTTCGVLECENTGS